MEALYTINSPPVVSFNVRSQDCKAYVRSLLLRSENPGPLPRTEAGFPKSVAAYYRFGLKVWGLRALV